MTTPKSSTVMSMDTSEDRSPDEAAALRMQALYQVKDVVRSAPISTYIDAVEFGILSTEEMARNADVRVVNRELYMPMSGSPVPNGVLDSRLGARKNDACCPTCKQNTLGCSGHWGIVKFFHPVFHTGYFKHLINILYCVCKSCSSVLLPDDKRPKFLHLMRSAAGDSIRRRNLFKQIVKICKDQKSCQKCNAPQGVLKRVQKPHLEQFMKIVLQIKTKDISGRTVQLHDDLDPLYVRTVLERIPPADCELLNITQPAKLLISGMPVPPTCLRPSITLSDAGTNEDDLTCILSEIVDLNFILQQQIICGAQTAQLLGNWEFLQLQCSRYINSDAPGIAQLLAAKGGNKVGRGICQRLKGKEGRFRGNLSGKRVDFSGRTVISPDPNCPIQELCVPLDQAKRLTFPERVCTLNIDPLRAAVLRGADEWPGASYVTKADGTKSSLRYANRRQVADGLQIGDTVERHLHNGDVVLFNRQPSLHRMSIMAHVARVRPWRTLRFNECVCQPYNADFDGDEMNLHLPQTQEARAEAYYLMGVANNLVTPKNGEPLVAATQDFLSGSFMLTHKDVFLTRDHFCQAIAHFTDGQMHIDLPSPTVLKPLEMWTGKQVFNALLRPNRRCHLIVNFELKERDWQRPQPEGPDGKDRLPDFMCKNDGWVMFRHAELVCGTIGKVTLGAGSKSGLFYNLIRDNTPQAAAEVMGRIAQLAGRWFCNRGMTIGIDDVTPSKLVTKLKGEMLDRGFADAEKALEDYRTGKMQPNPGCTLEETVEAKVKGTLDDLRGEGGKLSNTRLHPLNKPLLMFLSGAKGAIINLAQMIVLVGQQNVGGMRIQNGFVGRTLPHFPYGCTSGRSRGFVANSFWNGLQPDEFFFHTMSGREGLVDTAVKTAETGYMQRRLMKSLEDLSLRYDRTVRTSDEQIVQFIYGDDGLNPVMMESAQDGPMKLAKVMTHVYSFVKTPTDPLLVRRLSLRHSQFHLRFCERGDPPTAGNKRSHRDVSGCFCDHSDKIHPTKKSRVADVQESSGKSAHESLPVQPFTVLPPNTDSCLNAMIELHLQELNNPKSNVYSPRLSSAVDTQLVVLGEAGQTESASRQGAKAPTLQQQPAHDLNKYIRQKLQCLRSSRARLLGAAGTTAGSAELSTRTLWNTWDGQSQQVLSNLQAHSAVHDYLSPLKQSVPLFPYEIKEWSKYLVSRTAEALPKPLRDHQKLNLSEPPTHQSGTNTVHVFTETLQSFLDSYADSLARYRHDMGEIPADTLESYKDALRYSLCIAVSLVHGSGVNTDRPKKKGVKAKAVAKSTGIRAEEAEKEKESAPCGFVPKFVIGTEETAHENAGEAGTSSPLEAAARMAMERRFYLLRDEPVHANAVIGTQLASGQTLSTIPSDEELEAALGSIGVMLSDINPNVTLDWTGLAVGRLPRPRHVTAVHLLEFLQLAWRKYNRAITEPGEAVGAIGAQSIGEPGTQMTLKTFHFAGVASMNVTLGVPRIKEIINATMKIQTPIIDVPLAKEQQAHYPFALMVKGKIERTLIKDICVYIKEVFSPEGCWLTIKLCQETISNLMLDIGAEEVAAAIRRHSSINKIKLKEASVDVVSDFKLKVIPPGGEGLFFQLQQLKAGLLDVSVCGIDSVVRGVIKTEKDADTSEKYYSLVVEGSGLQKVMVVEGVVGERVISNSVMEVKATLGIEAARRVIIDEIKKCMDAYSMDIDSRHMQLLGDVMTFRGDVLGISRFGIQKMRASTLMLASFEETNEHLFEAAVHEKLDDVRGVSECIILGKPISLGTGAFDLLYQPPPEVTATAASTSLFANSPSSISRGASARRTALLAKYA